MRDRVTDFAKNVLAGEIPSGHLVKAACTRHLEDLEKSKNDDFPYFFDSSKSERFLRFCKLLKHYKGPMKGQNFDPLPWQQFSLGSVFGWIDKKTKLRRFRTAYIEVPRKNGKTFMSAGVALYGLVGDEEGGAEIYCGATKKDQAKILWSDAWAMIKAEPALGKHLSQRYNQIHFDANNAKFEPLGSDSKTLDGLNPHFGIIDEYHEHPDDSVYAVIEDGMGARSQPLMFTITTAGNNPYSVCKEMHDHCENVLLNKDFNDERLFSFIATCDPDEVDDWKNQKVWEKANPSLGAAKTLEYMQTQCDSAVLRPSKENSFKNKQLNIWTAVAKKWLDIKRWDDSGGDIDEELLIGKRCFVGMDLASKYDFASVAYVFPPDVYPEWTFLVRLFYPAENLSARERELRVPLRTWRDDGYITTTYGDMIDMDWIFESILKDSKRFSIQEIGFDPWRAVEIATKLQNEGFDMVQMRQGHGTLGAPTSEFETKVMRQQVRHGGNPVLRWMAGNVTTRSDANGNIVPDKSNEKQKIDGIVACIMGLGRGMMSSAEKISVYEERAPIIL